MAEEENGPPKICSIIVHESNESLGHKVGKMSPSAAAKYSKSAGSRDTVCTSLSEMYNGRNIEDIDYNVSADAASPPEDTPDIPAITKADTAMSPDPGESTCVDLPPPEKKPPKKPPAPPKKIPEPPPPPPVKDLETMTPSATEAYISQARVEDIGPKNRARKRSVWYRIRKQYAHVGLAEILADHSCWTEANAFTTGMYSIWTSPYKYEAKDGLEHSDYTEELHEEFICPPDKSFKYTRHCDFISYAPAAFATIRRAVNIKEQPYHDALISAGKPLLEFVSNSRSGMDFFLTHDMRYLIKTNKESDITFLFKILGKYVQHFLDYPHSLIVKFLGLYSMEISGKEKIWILVMQNIFYPADRMEVRYDIKGCLANRWETPDPPGSRAMSVLKDQNFLEEMLDLGPRNRDWFLKQLNADASFFKSLNCLDYSILVAKQKLHPMEKELAKATSSTMGTLVARIRQSGMTKAPPPSPHRPSNPGDDPQAAAHYDPESKQHLGVLVEGPANSADEYRRLLPDHPNGIHIIDGPEYRYFLGIVDFLTVWTLKQRMNQIMKLIKHGCGDQSTVPPAEYSRRFVNFVSDHVL